MAKHLSKEEELELGSKIQKMLKFKENFTKNSAEDLKEYNSIVNEGNQAIEKLVESNINLVYNRAHAFKKKFPGAGLFEDLAQDGMEGLMKAVYKFDPKMGNKFSTVAYYWIVQSIGRGTNKSARLVRLPENRISDYTKMLKIINRYEDSNLSEAEIESIIMKEMKLTKEDISVIKAAASTHASLNKVISTTPGSTKELIDFVGEDYKTGATEDIVMYNSIMEILTDNLSTLTDLQKDVISSAFSLEHDSLSPKAIREKHHISNIKYKDILNKTLISLKDNFNDLGIKFEDFIK